MKLFRLENALPLDTTIPEPSLVCLIGAAGSGKSTWASTWPATQVLELDTFRALVSDDEGCQESTGDAVFALQVVLEARLARRKTTILDATNTGKSVRADLIATARRHGVPTVALVVPTPVSVCVERQESRPANRRVPEPVVRAQHAAMVAALPGLPAEGFDHVVVAENLYRLQELLQPLSDARRADLGWDDSEGLGDLLLVRRTFGPEILPMWRWRDGSQLAAWRPRRGDPARSGPHRPRPAQRHRRRGRHRLRRPGGLPRRRRVSGPCVGPGLQRHRPSARPDRRADERPGRALHRSPPGRRPGSGGRPRGPRRPRSAGHGSDLRMTTNTRENPAPTTPDTVPAGCQWFTDPDGALCLAPGCMARIQDPEAQCLCDTLAARLDRLTETLRDLEERQRYADVWWHALSSVVRDHPDERAILAETRVRTGADPRPHPAPPEGTCTPKRSGPPR